ncbi:unnamed protein product [Cercospora beticola]|nr:unnamed protein product [Cercospora beticola]
MFFSKISSIALMAMTAHAQVRNLDAYVGSNVACQAGEFVTCSDVNPCSCCVFDGRSFGSTRITNPQANDLSLGGIPPTDGNAGCNFIARGNGGQCVSDGPNGFSAFSWEPSGFDCNRRVGGSRRAVSNEVEADLLTFADGTVYDLRNMSAADKKELADVVYSGQGSAGVPAHIQKHRK